MNDSLIDKKISSLENLVITFEKTIKALSTKLSNLDSTLTIILDVANDSKH